VLFVFSVEECYDVVDITYVEVQSGESVYVTWAEDPTDFRVILMHSHSSVLYWSSVSASVFDLTSIVNSGSSTFSRK